ncbi:hypothetical protein [Sphaerisporangium album]|nr:hypothetical protein [Sphaerisporangium album]
MPYERDAALEFRQEHEGVHFWCGTVSGCGRPLFTRIGDERIPHFYHLGESEAQCRLAKRSRGRLDIEPEMISAELKRWRQSRDLPEGEAVFRDPIDRFDARYIHISDPASTRDTRVVLGNITITKVLEDAESPQGREWDWFVHERNSEVTAILDRQGVAYGRFRFVMHATSATLEVFLSTPDNVGDWGRISRYVPAPNRAPRPLEPAPPVTADLKPGPARAPVPQRAAASGPARERVDRDALIALEAQFPPRRGLDGGPTREPASARRAPRPLASEPTRQHAPRSEEQIANEFKDAIADLKEALDLGDRKNKARCARRLHALRKAHRKSLSSDDNRAIKALLKEASPS